MCITRRHILALTGGCLFSRLFGATLPGANEPGAFDVDRLLSGNPRRDTAKREIRKYTASATVTLFTIPLVSRSGVGSGYAIVEEAGPAISIRFGAGSYPESARGLNRLGFIHEAVIEERAGCPAECAWLAFMTTSQEKNLDQAKGALETSGSTIPYTASQGYGRSGRFTSRVDRLEFPSRYTWRDITALVEKARGAMAADSSEKQEVVLPASEQPASEQAGTFLYMVRRAMLDTRLRTTGCLVFNKKQFRLDANKEPDTAATTYFTGKTLVPSSGRVMRMNATLTEERTGEKTPFRLWYQAGAEQSPPLRFEYQAKSFLRLTFEEDA